MDEIVVAGVVLAEAIDRMAFAPAVVLGIVNTTEVPPNERVLPPGQVKLEQYVS